MISRLYKQFPWPTVMTILGVMLMLGLGTWQLYRLSWKNALQVAVDNKRSLPIINDESFLRSPLTIIQDAEYQRLQITGIFLHDYEMKLMGRVRQGQSGFHIVTPLRTPSGAIVIVDRGWVPFKGDVTVDRSLTPQTLTGYIQIHVFKNMFTPNNDWNQRELYRLDPIEIGQQCHLTNIAPFIFKQESEPAVTHYPIPMGLNFTLYNQHLQYAITWYMFAFILMVIYIAFIRKKLQVRLN